MITPLVLVSLFFIFNMLRTWELRVNNRLIWFFNILLSLIGFSYFSSNPILLSFLSGSFLLTDINFQFFLNIFFLFLCVSFYSNPLRKSTYDLNFFFTFFYFLGFASLFFINNIAILVFVVVFLFLIELIETFLTLSENLKLTRDVILCRVLSILFILLGTVFYYLSTNDLDLLKSFPIRDNYYSVSLSCYVVATFLVFELPPFHGLLFRRLREVDFNVKINQILFLRPVLLFFFIKLLSILFVKLNAQDRIFFETLVIVLLLSSFSLMLIRLIQSRSLEWLRFFLLNFSAFFAFIWLVSDDFSSNELLFFIQLGPLGYLVLSQIHFQFKESREGHNDSRYLCAGLAIIALGLSGFPISNFFNLQLLLGKNLSSLLSLGYFAFLSVCCGVVWYVTLSIILKTRNGHHLALASGISFTEKTLLLVLSLLAVAMLFFPVIL